MAQGRRARHIGVAVAVVLVVAVLAGLGVVVAALVCDIPPQIPAIDISALFTDATPAVRTSPISLA